MSFNFQNYDRAFRTGYPAPMIVTKPDGSLEFIRSDEEQYDMMRNELTSLRTEVERMRGIIDNLEVQATKISDGWISIPEVEWEANMKEARHPLIMRLEIDRLTSLLQASDAEVERLTTERDDALHISATKCSSCELVELRQEVERLREALLFINRHGGGLTEGGISLNGKWCAEQARRALDREPLESSNEIQKEARR